MSPPDFQPTAAINFYKLTRLNARGERPREPLFIRTQNWRDAVTRWGELRARGSRRFDQSAGRPRSPLRAAGCQRTRPGLPRRRARSNAPCLRASVLECGGPPPLLKPHKSVCRRLAGG
jgi:hypothetical protein